MITILSFIITWDSADSVSRWVTFFDYAGFVDLAAAALMLIPVLSRSKRWEGKWVQITAGFIAVIGAGCWIMDSKLNHRLTDLQSKASAQEMVQIEHERDQALEAAKTAETASTNASAQAEKLASANAKVADLDSAAQWRTITPEQTARFIESAKNMPTGSVFVITKAQTAETRAFASELRDMFASAGYAHADEWQETQDFSSGPPPRGISLIISSPNPPPHLASIESALKQISVPFNVAIDNPRGLPEDSVRVYVCEK